MRIIVHYTGKPKCETAETKSVPDFESIVSYRLSDHHHIIPVHLLACCVCTRTILLYSPIVSRTRL